MTRRVNQLEADREEWEGWVSGELARTQDGVTGGWFDIWDAGRRGQKIPGGPRSDAAAYAGSWKSVKPYLSTEFIYWIPI